MVYLSYPTCIHSSVAVFIMFITCTDWNILLYREHLYSLSHMWTLMYPRRLSDVLKREIYTVSLHCGFYCAQTRPCDVVNCLLQTVHSHHFCHERLDTCISKSLLLWNICHILHTCALSLCISYTAAHAAPIWTAFPCWLHEYTFLQCLFSV